MDYAPRLPASDPAKPSQNIIQTALQAARVIGEARANPCKDGVPYAVLPRDYELVDLPTEVMPKRPTAKVLLRDAESFVRFFNDHKDMDSRVYATIDPPKFVAVFDELLSTTPVIDQGNWREFRALFEVPLSREWKIWTASNKMAFNQLSFAEFLQDNVPDVIMPSGADLLDISLNFEASQTGKFVSAHRMENGSQNLAWVTDTDANQTVKLPPMITLKIPVFENDDAYEIEARLRYKIDKNAGKLTLWYELIRPHKVLEAAFQHVYNTIKKDGDAIILLGTPE